MQQQLTPVKSSKFLAMGYDEDTFELFLQFHPTRADAAGAIYRYQNVSPELFDDLQKAESLGKFFNERILRNPDHPASRLPSGDAEQAQAPEASTAEQAVEPEPQPAETFRDPEDAIATAVVVAKQARAIVISTPEAYGLAGRELVRIAGEIRRRREFFAPMKEAAFRAHRAICSRETEALQPLEQAERALTGGISQYRQAEEQRRRAEQDRIDAERRRLAQIEADERAKQAAEEQARQLEAKGQAEKAAQVRANPAPVAPAYVAPAIVQKDVPKVEGLSFAKVWDFEITDATQVPLSHEYYTLDESKIRAKVKALQGHTNIPGVRVFASERARKKSTA